MLHETVAMFLMFQLFHPLSLAFSWVFAIQRT